MDWDKQNLTVYNNSAAALAEYFSGIGPRTDDIERGLQLAGLAIGEGRVVEIGCGDGRDALEIVPRVKDYTGIDPSEGLLDIARERLPAARFISASAQDFDYQPQTDAVFAFASLLHVEINKLMTVLEKINACLKQGGVLYLSLKEKSEYCAKVKQDKYGERMFYYYNPQLIKEMAPPGLQTVYEDRQTIGSTDWFTLALRKS